MLDALVEPRPSKTGRWILSRRSIPPLEPEKYRDGIDALPRQGRLWMVFSHVQTGSMGNEEDLILRYVGEIGKVIDNQHYSQASLYLVSLGAGASDTAQ